MPHVRTKGNDIIQWHFAEQILVALTTKRLISQMTDTSIFLTTATISQRISKLYAVDLKICNKNNFLKKFPTTLEIAPFNSRAWRCKQQYCFLIILQKTNDNVTASARIKRRSEEQQTESKMPKEMQRKSKTIVAGRDKSEKANNVQWRSQVPQACTVSNDCR